MKSDGQTRLNLGVALTMVLAHAAIVAADECPARRTCADTQNYRRHFTTASVAPTTGEFLACLDEVSQKVAGLQSADALAIQSMLSDLGIQSIGLQELRAISASPTSPLRRQLGAIVEASRASRPGAGGPDFHYSNAWFTYSGPIVALLESLSGNAYDPSKGSSTGPKYEVAGLTELAEHAADLRGFLIERMSVGYASGEFPISPQTRRSAITPTVAKYLLWEVIRQKAGDDRQQASLLEKLRLKFSYERPEWPAGKAIDSRSVGSFSLHDGYFLGARTDFSRPELGQSVGVECANYLKACLDRVAAKALPDAGLVGKFRKLDLRSPELARFGSARPPKDYLALFTGEALRCEEQLKVGDLIAIDGHVLVFAGYAANSHGEYQLVTYESLGGEYRATGRFHREIYRDGASCADVKFHSGADDRPAAVVRLRGL